MCASVRCQRRAIRLQVEGTNVQDVVLERLPRDDAQEAAHAAVVSSMFIRSRICDINKFSKRTAAASTWTLGSGQGDPSIIVSIAGLVRIK